MAHSCPDCNSACYCGGDIDDIFFEDSEEEMLCTHCCDHEEDDDWDDFDDADHEQTDGGYGTHPIGSKFGDRCVENKVGEHKEQG